MLYGNRQICIVLCLLSLWTSVCFTMSDKRRISLKNSAKEMFDHGWNSYYQHAFPKDELNPFQCNGRGSDKKDPSNININDVLGDYSLTLVDTLDTLAILGTQEQFEEAVNQVIKTVSFNKDTRVQVFELNIRALGGLISAHMLATEPSFHRTIPGYNGELLSLAKDLADRLMPAFNKTPTGIPYPRVNLKKGFLANETTETCTAGAGSLILEFGVLSRLLNDPSYENVAKNALKSVWNGRSHINLLGNVLDIKTGYWIHTASSTGAGIDSVFEYMLKAYVLFGEEEYKDMFDEAYKAILLHIRDTSGYLYRNVDMSSGGLVAYWIDSLGAFFPGLQVLYGDLSSAIKNHLVYYNIWKRYHALPERFDFYHKHVELGNYPLRPEFIESTYHLYQATKDPFYLEVGEMVLNDLNNRTRLPCGFASIGDVQTGRLEDRMESFMLSETLKYLYLLFDTDHPIHSMDSNFVYTTEGHILPLPQKYLTKATNLSKKKKKSMISFTNLNTCQRYNPNGIYSIPNQLDMSSIPYQPQADYAAAIVGYTDTKVIPLSKHGYCETPWTASKSFGLTFSVAEYNHILSTHHSKNNNLIEILGGYLLKSLSGLRIELTAGRKNDGYLVKRVSNTSLKPTDTLKITMSALLPYLETDPSPFGLRVRQPGITTIIRNYFKMEKDVLIRSHDTQQCIEVLGKAGPIPFSADIFDACEFHVFGDQQRLLGCELFTEKERKLIQGKVLVMALGGYCNLLDKLAHAQKAGAIGVIFFDNSYYTFRPPTMVIHETIAIPSFTINSKDATKLARMVTEKSTFQITKFPSIDTETRVSLYYRGGHVKNIVIVNK